MPKVLFIAEFGREDVAETIRAARDAVAAHAEVIDVEPGETHAPEGVQAAVVVGGDGTLIRAARRLAGSGVPLAGVNVGRLGFLAEFDAESIGRHLPAILDGRAAVDEAMMLRTIVRGRDGAVRYDDGAVNDSVVTAGRPFRMIELGIVIDGAPVPTLTGDGLIVSTTVGTTAYNASAGGPIVHPALEAMVLTPLAAHSLAFRPIVVRGDAVVRLHVHRANEGTSLVQDGEQVVMLRTDDEIEIRVHERHVRLARNPEASWLKILREKLKWAAPPTYREGG